MNSDGHNISFDTFERLISSQTVSHSQSPYSKKRFPSSSPPTPRLSHRKKKRERHTPTAAELDAESKSRSDSLSKKANTTRYKDTEDSMSDTEKAPKWFTSYLREFREFRNEVSTDIKQQESRLLHLEKSVADLRLGVSSNEAHELLFLGIPADITATNEEVAKTLFKVMQVESCIKFILSIRVWAPQRRNTGAAAGADISISALPGPTRPGTLNQAAEDLDTNAVTPKTKGLVIKMVSAVARDEVVSHSINLKDLTAANVFGFSGDSKLYCRALWPKDVHMLLSKTRQERKRLNLYGVFVRGLTVYVKPTKDKPPIAIRSEDDLQTLQRQAPPN